MDEIGEGPLTPGYLKRKDLLSAADLEPDEIELILQTARPFKEIFTRSIKKVPTLRGRTVVLLFYEPSTRTRTSFELAAKRLSADTVNITVSASSVVKGESLLDTAKTIEAMKADFVVLRHQRSGACHMVANRISASVINAGDGTHEHPTQGLLDAFTILEKKGHIRGLHIALIGDILHSRVARSNFAILKKMGATLYAVGPPTLVPDTLKGTGVMVHHRLEEIIQRLDVINILRIQKERLGEHLFPSIEEYSYLYGIDMDRLRDSREELLIMHPGPMNRGIEISGEVADSALSVINEQVTNGIAVRMAVLYLLGGKRGETGN